MFFRAIAEAYFGDEDFVFHRLLRVGVSSFEQKGITFIQTKDQGLGGIRIGAFFICATGTVSQGIGVGETKSFLRLEVETCFKKPFVGARHPVVLILIGRIQIKNGCITLRWPLAAIAQRLFKTVSRTAVVIKVLDEIFNTGRGDELNLFELSHWLILSLLFERDRRCACTSCGSEDHYRSN